MIQGVKKGNFFCFGCNESGDALKFVIKMENILHKSNDLQGCKKYFKILKSNKFEKIKFNRIEKFSRFLKKFDIFYVVFNEFFCDYLST